MFLIAGGQFDTNITALADRLDARGVASHALLIGPTDEPRLHIDLDREILQVNGKTLTPSACFIRQDVFLYPTPDIGRAQVKAQNWYCAIRGWIEACPDTRLFNRSATLRENNKIFNLVTARQCGLRVPPTIVANDLTAFAAEAERLIEKPVAGGEYTAHLRDSIASESRSGPRFVQPRLACPEYRIYRIGPALMAFELRSEELDYRRTQQVTLTPVAVPDGVARPLTSLCDRLDLDFAAADFMLDDDGRLNFLEINSQPMFAAFDRAVEGRLCDAIIDALLDSTALDAAAHRTARRVAVG